MNPIRVAVLGAGLIGRRHIETVCAMPSVAELVAVVDPIVDHTHFGLDQSLWFGDTEQMLDQVKPEAVIIATPNNFHAAQGQMCCARSIHFLVEKPVTATIQEAEMLVRSVDNSGVRTLVGHHRRYLAPIVRAKQIIEDGTIGTLVAVSVVWATRKPDDYFNTAWRTQPGGGPILINAIHEIDLLRHLCGEVRSVSGYTSNMMRKFVVEDTAACMFQFDSGCLGTLICTDAGFSPWTIEQGTHENPRFAYTAQSAYRLIGTKGSLELPVLRTWTAANRDEIGWDRPIAPQDLQQPYRDPYQAQLEHFQRLIRLGEPPVVSVRDGAATLAATLAVVQSSQQSRPCVPAIVGQP